MVRMREDVEEVTKKVEMKRNSKKSFTEMHKNRDVQNCLRIKVVEFNSIIIQESKAGNRRLARPSRVSQKGQIVQFRRAKLMDLNLLQWYACGSSL